MDESVEDLNADDLHGDSFYPIQSTSSTDASARYPSLARHSAASSSSKRKAVDCSVPWRFCLAPLQRCTDASNSARFRELISKYSELHFRQRRSEAISRGRQLWSNLEERYGNLNENWYKIETDLITKEPHPYAFVNILIREDPAKGPPCRATRRINGVCRAHPEHNIRDLRDPRSRQRPPNTSTRLLMPKYYINDYIAFAPPRRELTFVGLNDNVKEEYLRDFCSAKGRREIVNLHIYMHPTTGSHMGMALVQFKTTDQTMEFFKQQGQNPRIMGFSAKLFVDTLGFWVTDEYKRITDEEPSFIPPRQKFLKKEEEIERIRKLIRIQNAKDNVFDNYEREELLFQAISPNGVLENESDDEQIFVKPAGARTPLGLPEPSSDSAHSSRTASRVSIKGITPNETPKAPVDRENGNHTPRPKSRSSSNTRGRSRSPNSHHRSRHFRNYSNYQVSPRRSRRDYENKRYSNGRFDSYDKHRRGQSRSPNRRRKSNSRRNDRDYSNDRTRSNSHRRRHRKRRSVSSSSTRSTSSVSDDHRSSRRRRKREENGKRLDNRNRRSSSRSEVTQHVDTINLCVQPPPAPNDLQIPSPFVPSYPPPTISAAQLSESVKSSLSECGPNDIQQIAQDVPTRVRKVERELGPFNLLDKTQRALMFKQMYTCEHGLFVVPTVRMFCNNSCSFILVNHYIEPDQKAIMRKDPRVTAIADAKAKLRTDLLVNLNTNICQKIETLMYKEVDRLHAEYEEEQKKLNTMRSKAKREEPKQLFDFDEQFRSGSGMGTKSMFGMNSLWNANKNILSTKKIPKKTPTSSHQKKKSTANAATSVRVSGDTSPISSPEASRSTSRMSANSQASSSVDSTSQHKQNTSSSSSTASDADSPTSGSYAEGNRQFAADNRTTEKFADESSSRLYSPSQLTAFKESMLDKDVYASLGVLPRKIQRVDYYEDSSSSSAAGDSDWAEQNGIDDVLIKRKKKAHKHSNKRPRISEENSQTTTEVPEAKRLRIAPEKPVEAKPEIEFDTENNVENRMDVENQIDVEEPAVPKVVEKVVEKVVKKKTSDVITIKLDDDNVFDEIKLEPKSPTITHEPLVVESVQPKKPKAARKKIPVTVSEELPKEDPRFANVSFLPRNPTQEAGILVSPMDEEDIRYIMMASQNVKITVQKEMPNKRKIERLIRFNNPFTANEDGNIIPPSHPVVAEGAARLRPWVKGQPKVYCEEQLIRTGRIEVTRKDEQAAQNRQEKRRELRMLQRNLVSTVGDCPIVRQNVMKFREKMLKFARSSIHGWGLFTLEDIQPNDMIIEYVGEMIRSAVADVRECNYTRRGIGSSYLFRMDEELVIDATGKGNVARFINHSCNPNCYARVIGRSDQRVICIYAKRLISKGEEITYDYKFPLEEEKIACHCGAENCRLYLN
ncbi:Histone-lysine N-methyltransferase [Aphelenchoides besseyi]|nr:Histone-lysine N-methyltransferase [Aphelenchoides besseyi]KAI6200979.1 Histone-lysine N-methyltransferase [Aphelenchoides besseyi]